MRKIRRRSIRLTKDPAYSAAVGGYESLSRQTRSRQLLMKDLVAPFMATCRVSTQKSAEGIVVVTDEGPNVEMSGASDSLYLVSVRRVVLIADSDLIRLRPDDFHEPPTAATWQRDFAIP